MTEGSKVVLPWEMLGTRLEEFRGKLDDALVNDDIQERVAYIQITCYRVLEQKGKPDREFRLSSGDPGQGFPIGGQLIGTDESDDEREQESSPGHKLVVEMLKSMVRELKADLEPYPAFPAAGVRAMLTASGESARAVPYAFSTPGGFYYCSGWACEYSYAAQGWFWCEYYTDYAGQCRRRFYYNSPC
jgi:hypothetical protein